jgi:tRNA-(ms[2]io[6]A)-hydroxylase
MVSEANHYTIFLGFARQFQNRNIVDEKWQALLDYEADFMKNRGGKATVHG